jgi:hypothetical protein
MRCPRCLDEYEPDVATCATCGIALVGDDEEFVPPPPTADTRLGTFHPLAVGTVLELCDRRGVGHETRTTERGVEVLVEREWRDDLRAELTLGWGDLMRRLDEDDLVQLLASGGSTPGWVDPPRGGHVDRRGRLVVADDEEEADADANRLIGPALLTTGVIVLVLGWYLVDSAALMALGTALALAGLVLPR